MAQRKELAEDNILTQNIVIVLDKMQKDKIQSTILSVSATAKHKGTETNDN